MNWSMPRPVRQGVAVLLATAWAAALIWGVVTAPSRGRLPGQAPAGASGQPLQAQDATPLSEERIEGAPAPVVLTEAEKAALEAEKKAKAEAAQLARAEAERVRQPVRKRLSPLRRPWSPKRRWRPTRRRRSLTSRSSNGRRAWARVDVG